MSQVFPSKYEGILPARHAKPKGRITELLHLLAHVVKAAFHLAALVLGLFTCCSKWVTLTEFGWISVQNKWHMTTIIPLTRSTRVQRKEIYLFSNPLVRKRSTKLDYPFSGGCTVFEACENWGITIPGFLMESDTMGCLSDKSMCVGVLCTISDIGGKKGSWKIVLLEKCRDQRNLQMFCIFFKPKESVSINDIPG